MLHSEILGVRNSTYLFWGETVKPITVLLSYIVFLHIYKPHTTLFLLWTVNYILKIFKWKEKMSLYLPIYFPCFCFFYVDLGWDWGWAGLVYPQAAASWPPVTRGAEWPQAGCAAHHSHTCRAHGAPPHLLSLHLGVALWVLHVSGVVLTVMVSYMVIPLHFSFQLKLRVNERKGAQPGLQGAGNVLFLHLGAGCTGVFTLGELT